MTWTRLSDDFADSPEVLALSDAAFRAHITALIWSNKQLTDGVVPTRAVRLFTASDPAEIIDELVASGLWVEDGATYRLDWSDQEKAEAVTARQEANAARNRTYRERGRRHAAGDHSMCDRCSAKKRDGQRDASRDASRAPYPSRPDPTHREGREGKAEEAASAEATAATSARRAEVETKLRDLVILTEREIPRDGWFDQTSDEDLETDLALALNEIDDPDSEWYVQALDTTDPLIKPPTETDPELWDALSPWGRELWIA